jgi:hypothetical protein
MSELTDQLSKLLDDANEKNHDPRMEELMRSDRLIDPSYENLSVLEDQEIFHIAKIRGAQKGLNVSVRRIKKVYETKDMLDYHTPWMDYVRSLDEKNPYDKVELDSKLGDLVIINEMVKQLIVLRPALEGKRANLYADSIKQQVINNPASPQQMNEPQEGFFSKAISFLFGKKDSGGSNQGYNGRGR